MKAIVQAQASKSRAWHVARETALASLPKGRTSLFEANRMAYAYTTLESLRLDSLLADLFDTILRLEKSLLRTGEEATFRRLADFLRMDIPAFRCGYGKEWALRILKRAHLSLEQRQELKAIVLLHVRSPHFRREFSGMARLMIPLADPAFLADLAPLLQDPSPRIRRKARLIWDRIFHSRGDLRSSFPPFPITES